jgi:hypothetical protein
LGRHPVFAEKWGGYNKKIILNQKPLLLIGGVFVNENAPNISKGAFSRFHPKLPSQAGE